MVYVHDSQFAHGTPVVTDLYRQHLEPARGIGEYVAPERLMVVLCYGFGTVCMQPVPIFLRGLVATLLTSCRSSSSAESRLQKTQ
jgi:tetrahydromethanopterin S-methyltransferase subunit E